MESITFAAARPELIVSIHWLAFTTRLRVGQVLVSLAELVFGYYGENPAGLFRVSDVGMNGYQRRYEGRHGVKVLFSEGREDVHVIIPGEACECAVPSDLLALFKCDLVRFRRIDLAFDGLVDERDRAVRPLRIYSMCKHHPERVKTWANIRGKRKIEVVDGERVETVSR